MALSLNGNRESLVARDEVLRLHELQTIKIRPWWRPTVRILIVTDAGGSFDGASFGLEKVVAELRNDPWWWVRFEVVTAHRGAEPSAQLTNFNFASPPDGVTLDGFDEIWLFGVDGSNDISAAEVAALTGFMDDGGGVFATGDHDDLGSAICANLPRINKMRQWRSGGVSGTPPSGGGTGRHDTLRAGATAGFQEADQSDDVGQVISPTRYYDPWGYFALRTQWRPHPLLCGPHGILDVLPDHFHEGNCVVPSAASVAANPAEWPGGTGPEIVATASVLGHSTEGVLGAVTPKSFGVISAYDGHLNDRGRISCDATWHHWFNINLIGFPAGSSYYDKIRNYYWNTALWLAPRAKQGAMFSAAAFGLPSFGPFNEYVLQKNLSILDLGLAGVDAIGRRASQCTATEWLLAQLPRALERQLYRRPIPPDPDPTYAGLEFVREFAMGGVMRQILDVVDPANPRREPPTEKDLTQLVQRGMHEGLRELASFERRGLEQAQRNFLIVESVLDAVRL